MKTPVKILAATVVVGLVGAAVLAGGAMLSPSGETKNTAPSFSASDLKVPKPTATYPAKSSPGRQQITDSGVKPQGFADPPPGQGLSRYFSQQVSWNKCGAFDCATVLTPLDWADPDGQAITLALKRRSSTAANPLGSLFINPGGPGGSATEYVERFSTKNLERYSIVGVDPRGSGQSTPVVCGDGPQTDVYQNLDFSPDDEAETQALIEGIKVFGKQCREKSGVLLDHISSIETVHDFDLVRQLLGDQKFNFLGVSYGTYLGALYTELYPQNVGHIVMDAAVNITDSEEVVQAQGFDRALNAFADDCASRNCRLGTTKDEVIAKVVKLLEKLDARPMQVGNRQLTQSIAISGLSLFLYSGQKAYSSLEASLNWAIYEGEGKYLLQASDLMVDRNNDGTYGTLTYAFPAILCRDSQDDGVADALRDWQHDAKVAPIFGRFGGPNLVCPLWPAKPDEFVKFSGAGAPPVLVIGSTGDNATPYEQAVWMADQLQSAVLITRVGAGHGSYSSGNTCVATAVQSYLNDGTAPAQDIRCE